MGRKSIHKIHREIQLEKHRETPIGKLELKLANFYKNMEQSKKQLPEELAKKIYDIRDANEKAQLDYIERTNREHRDFIDKSLFDSMSLEWGVIEEYLKDNQSTTEHATQ